MKPAMPQMDRLIRSDRSHSGTDWKPFDIFLVFRRPLANINHAIYRGLPLRNDG